MKGKYLDLPEPLQVLWTAVYVGMLQASKPHFYAAGSDAENMAWEAVKRANAGAPTPGVPQ